MHSFPHASSSDKEVTYLGLEDAINQPLSLRINGSGLRWWVNRRGRWCWCARRMVWRPGWRQVRRPNRTPRLSVQGLRLPGIFDGQAIVHGRSMVDHCILGVHSERGKCRSRRSAGRRRCGVKRGGGSGRALSRSLVAERPVLSATPSFCAHVVEGWSSRQEQERGPAPRSDSHTCRRLAQTYACGSATETHRRAPGEPKVSCQCLPIEVMRGEIAGRGVEIGEGFWGWAVCAKGPGWWWLRRLRIGKKTPARLVGGGEVRRFQLLCWYLSGAVWGSIGREGYLGGHRRNTMRSGTSATSYP
jgi:hypothetical protein